MSNTPKAERPLVIIIEDPANVPSDQVADAIQRYLHAGADVKAMTAKDAAQHLLEKLREHLERAVAWLTETQPEHEPAETRIVAARAEVKAALAAVLKRAP